MRADVSWVRVVGGSLVWTSLGICCFTSWRSPADVAVAQESTEKKPAERQPKPSEPDRKPEDVRRTQDEAVPVRESRDESREKLEREISCDLQEVPLSDLLEFLSKAIGLPVHLDEVSVDGSNIDRDKTFTARLKRVRAATMLDLLLEPRDLQWSLEEGTIEVFSIADAKDHREASVIGFHDLMPNDLEDRLTIMGRVRDELPHLFESEGQTDESFLSVDSRGFAVVRASSRREQ